jgi:hypothetical protein
MKKPKLGLYTALGLDGYELCHPVNQGDFQTISAEIDGTPRRASWKAIPVRLIHEDEGKVLVASDSPWLADDALIFRSSVVAALGPMLREYGELLPLACSEAELVIYNPTRVIDAFDDAASSVVRFSDGRIMMVRKYVFSSEVVGETDIFKIPNLRVSPTFFSHRFVDRWQASGLKGLEFKHVWARPN